MPELPEVETIKNVIEQQIKGLTIIKAAVRRPEVIAHPTADEFCALAAGRTILHMTRRGKFMAIYLDSNDRMILHLRMTGCLLLTPADFPEEAHTHVVFTLSDGRELRFSDTRRFGRFWLLRENEDDIYSGAAKLGIEPHDPVLTAAYLKTSWGKSRRAIKDCLLDQSVVAGIGNIYSDEILFVSKIHPARPANSLKQKEWERLAAAIPERISYFIEKNRLSPEEYLATKGKEYRNTPYLLVYGLAGKPCPHCGETLARITVGGRSSVYCRRCQKR